MWKPLKTKIPINLSTTLFCGQIFHFTSLPNGIFYGNVLGYPAILAQHGNDIYFFNTCDQIEAALGTFFNLDVALPSDFEASELRFITNDIHSAIFSFICSTNNKIKRITKMVSFIYSLGVPFDLAATYHAPPDYTCPPFLPDISAELDSFKIYSFPPLDKIAQGEAIFREAKFGYRSRYVVAAADFLLGFHENWSDLPFETARDRLMSIKGVGRKVADCICLTSLRFFHVVPLDIHIIRYSLTEFNLPYKKVNAKAYKEIQRLWIEKYGEFAGVQQLYEYKRSIDRSS